MDLEMDVAFFACIESIIIGFVCFRGGVDGVLSESLIGA